MSPTTIRTWERTGLVAPARAANGWRMFSWRDVELLQRARDLSRRGLTSGEIRRRLRRKPLLRFAEGQRTKELGALPALKRLSRGLERGRQAILALPVAVRPA